MSVTTHRKLRLHTCTPVDFAGDHSFFGRDSGLLTVGLRQIGCDSMAIMPGPERENDWPDHLIRTKQENLRSADWWKSLDLDGLIFYSWASPRYTDIAKAISEAGIPCLVAMDNSGVISRTACPHSWLRESLRQSIHEPTDILDRFKRLCIWLIEATTNYTARRRLAHYRAATAISVVTPHAVMWVKNEIKKLDPERTVKAKAHYLPHPQPSIFTYPGTKKEPIVLSVARWNKSAHGQKNPQLLLETFNAFLSRNPTWKCAIIGKDATRLIEWFPQSIHTTNIERMEFIEHLDQEALVTYYQRASIASWASRWEGQQGTAAQALCCGCSVVAPDAAAMSCFRHYITRESGRLSYLYLAEALAEELSLEAAAWDQGQRDPASISSIWQEEFHAHNVASRALGILNIPNPTP